MDNPQGPGYTPSAMDKPSRASTGRNRPAQGGDAPATVLPRTVQERAARALSRIHSVLFRLMLSFAALIFLVAVTVSGVSYLFFQDKYKAELARFHELYLKNIEKELEDRLVDSSKAVYMEIASLLSEAESPFFGPEDGIAGQSDKIYGTYVFLGNLAARDYEGIEAIHLYYAKSGLLISSAGYRAGGAGDNIGDGRAWRDELVGLGRSSVWKPYDRPAYLGIPEMRLFRVNRSYPVLSPPEEGSVIVSVDYRADRVVGIMRRLLPGESGVTVLMGPGQSSMIGAEPGFAWDNEVDAAIGRMLGGEGDSLRGETVRSKGNSTLVTVLPLADSGWSLVNAVSYSSLYQRSSGIKAALLLICLAAIALGLAVSAILSSRIYNPLDRLLARFRSAFRLPAAQEGEGSVDEYEYLDSALDGISSRMGELEAAIDTYRPAIKNELVVRLLEGEPVEREELAEAFSLLGIPSLSPHLVAGLVALPAAGMIEAEGGTGAGQLLKYRVAAGLESAFPGQVLCGILPGPRLALLLAAGEGAPSASDLSARARGLAGEGFLLALGPAVDGLEGLALSFSAARSLAAFRFIYPELEVLENRADLLSRSGHSALPDGDYLQALEACLRKRDLVALRSQLERFRQSARGSEASVQACLSDLERIIGLMVSTAKEMGVEAAKTMEANLRDLLRRASSLDAFLGELSSAAGDICAGDRDPQAERNSALARRVKDYVRANLAGDLSLDRVSAAMALSPGYMCTVFKEATGANFVAFVKDARVEEAARLLAEGREPVQEIGRRTGFNSPAYFIRVFKARYGQTPLDYRRSHAGT